MTEATRNDCELFLQREVRFPRARVTIRQTFPSKVAMNEVVEKYSAIEGRKQHLAKLEAYLGQMLT